jgi:RNA polymerase sigma-70 factor, ECF subfamily
MPSRAKYFGRFSPPAANYPCKPLAQRRQPMTPTTLSDNELLRLMRAGDERAFAVLYEQHQGAVYRFALLMSGAKNIAEEVTQDVFLMLVREPQRYDPERGSLPTYLYGVARNYVLRSFKRERPYVPLQEDTEESQETSSARFLAKDDPLNDYSRNELVRLVRQAVLSLPERYREVVVLCDFQEVSCAEAAAALECPIGTINSRLHRGHAMLVKKLRSVAKVDAKSVNSQALRCFA